MRTLGQSGFVKFASEQEVQTPRGASPRQYYSRFFIDQNFAASLQKSRISQCSPMKIELSTTSDKDFAKKNKSITTSKKKPSEIPVNISEIRSSQHKAQSEEGEEEYNGLSMPADWELAKNHALARRVAPDKKKQKNEQMECCPCCGYQIEKEYLDYWIDPFNLSFLGSGFPLFYNFMKFCILLMFTQFLIKGVYNLTTNLMGDYCSQLKQVNGAPTNQTNCPNSFLLSASIANKLDKPEQIDFMQNMNIVGVIAAMLILFYFRKEQRFINVEIDEKMLTPADYTIFVKNIPTNLPVDYIAEIKHMFENFAVINSDVPIVVEKVVLVYDIEEIIGMEHDLDNLIIKKKRALQKYNPVMKIINKEIGAIQHILKELEKDTETNPDKFIGKAFVSFSNEDMKNLVLSRFVSLFQGGITPNLNEQDLQWNGQKLFIEEAPEPNAVDWEFLHVKTFQKFVCRIKVLIKTILFEIFCFAVIWCIALKLAKEVDEAHKEQLEGTLEQSTVRSISILSYVISFTIVLFNKFGVGKVLHYITDEEQRSNKTDFQISYAKKYSFCLFMNAAGIAYVIDIMIQGNIIGYGGFIYNESLVFFLNAVLPPIIWVIDPWGIIKFIQRHLELKKKEKSTVTQKEANFLMEDADYLSAKRYSDIMKTMWFTCFYGTAIPLGILLSMVGLILYYLSDKYNLLRRRTIKESISDKLSTEMISQLEYIILFSAVGEMTLTWMFFKYIATTDIVIFGIAIMYQVIPVESLSEYVFPRESNEEPVDYKIGRFEFQTDYDRENPVTKYKAIKEWNEILKEAEHDNVHMKLAPLDVGYDLERNG